MRWMRVGVLTLLLSSLHPMGAVAAVRIVGIVAPDNGGVVTDAVDIAVDPSNLQVPIPEPSAITLIGVGLLALALIGGRRR